MDEALIEEKLRVTNKATTKVTMFMRTSIRSANHLRAQLKYRRWLEFSSFSVLNLKLRNQRKEELHPGSACLDGRFGLLMEPRPGVLNVFLQGDC